MSTTLESADVRELINELARRSPSVIIGVLVPEDGQNHYTLTRWTGTPIVAAGILRAMTLDVDAALTKHDSEDADTGEDEDDDE